MTGLSVLPDRVFIAGTLSGSRYLWDQKTELLAECIDTVNLKEQRRLVPLGKTNTIEGNNETLQESFRMTGYIHGITLDIV